MHVREACQRLFVTRPPWPSLPSTEITCSDRDTTTWPKSWENRSMEIREYVSKVRWRLSILVLFPVVAGGVAFGLLTGTPDERLAQAVLTVPSSVVGGPSSGSVAQYMANFEQAIVSDPVIATITQELGVDGGEVREGLRSTQLGSSNL